MLIRKADDPSAVLSQLEALARSATPKKKRAVEDELRKVRAGIKGEREAAYLIDFDYGQSPDMAVIHDLRLEVNGRVAQIDHLLLHRSLHCFVLETKQLHAGLKITDGGEFLRWNDGRKTYEGMASPLAQNERHIAVLKEAFESLLLPQRAGVALTPVFHSFVLVPPNARVDRPAAFDTRRVIQMDLLRTHVESDLVQAGVPASTRAEEAWISPGALENFARQLAARHQPKVFDYARKLGLRERDNHDSERPMPDDALPPEFSAQRTHRGRRDERSGRRAFAWMVRLAYAGVLILMGTAVLKGARQIVPATANPAAPLDPEPVRASMPTPIVRPAAPAQIDLPSLLSLPQPAPSAPVAPPKPEPPPIVHRDDQSITATRSSGARIAEIRGNLPKIREEMRRSGLAAKPVHSDQGPDSAPDARCEPKPVMTDAEIAACRALASRR